MTKKDWRGLEAFFRLQRTRVDKSLAGVEARVAHRLKAIGQDRQTRLALSLEGAEGSAGALGPVRLTLDELDGEVE